MEKNKYIYLRKNNSFPLLYKGQYDAKKLIEMINEYSIKCGATILNKSFLGSIRSWENGRIISEKEITYPKSDKVIGLSTAPNRRFDYVILENESEFIKEIFKSFKSYENITFADYTLLNFSNMYDKYKNNELSDEDIKFLCAFLDEIKVDIKSSSSFTLPYGTCNINSDGYKNSFLLNYAKKFNEELKDVKSLKLTNEDESKND